MYTIIRPSKVKVLALDIAGATRAKEFTRVSRTFYDAVEAAAKAFIADRVSRHPSKGKTLT